MLRARYIASGQVQGVGFRPFIYKLATELALSGFVQNTPQGVVIEVQGERLAEFAPLVHSTLPPLARITSWQESFIPAQPAQSGRKTFEIITTAQGLAHAVLISPDVATCADCFADTADKNGRRYLYPFTNCTNCGPRYSITFAMPYDRCNTSMACFELCDECRAEYENPLDRRFHAQPNACPECGPQLWLAYSENARKLTLQKNIPNGQSAVEHNLAPQNTASEPCNVVPEGADAYADEAMRLLARELSRGAIAAVKGLGGYHLACDALNVASINRLRLLKTRPHKPLAIMLPDIASARQLATLNPEDEALLLAPERPIVLCPKIKSADATIMQALVALAPDTDYIGIMLPYTPLHYLLLQEFAAVSSQAKQADEAAPVGCAKHTELAGHEEDTEHAEVLPSALVMTSGNRGGEPIALSNREAVKRLGDMADVFLMHNRDILIRTDDSVVRALPFLTEKPPQACFKVVSNRLTTEMAGTLNAPMLVLRRARGYAPRPLTLPFARTKGAPAQPSILALGAELKNTLCLTRGDEAFVSQHIGDVQNLETMRFQEEIGAHLCKVLQVRPASVLTDAHPNFSSSNRLEFFEQLCSGVSGAAPLVVDEATEPAELTLDSQPEPAHVSSVTAPAPGFASVPASAQAEPVRSFTLQHHYAHAYAVLGENAVCTPALVLALDGTGYAPAQDAGAGARLWGGELLYVDMQQAQHKRIGRLDELPLPGGEAAIKEPWRIAHGLLYALSTAGTDAQNISHLIGQAASDTGQSTAQAAAPYLQSGLPWLPAKDAAARVLEQMLTSGLNSPLSSSAGRLFDAVSALLGLCSEVSYEGQAAILLEAAQGAAGEGGAGENFYAEFSTGCFVPEVLELAQPSDCSTALSFAQPQMQPSLLLASNSLFKSIYDNFVKAKSPESLRLAIPQASRFFHYSLAEGLANLALVGSRKTGTKLVGLSGGVMQNMSLVCLLHNALKKRGLTPLMHRELPANDGCISYGQAVYQSVRQSLK